MQSVGSISSRNADEEKEKSPLFILDLTKKVIVECVRHTDFTDTKEGVFEKGV